MNRRVTTLLAGSFLVAGALAQTAFPLRAETEPTAIGKPYKNDAGKLCVATANGRERCLGDKDAPAIKRREVMTKTFWIITAINLGTSILAIEGTQHCLHAGTCRELNPLLGSSRKQAYPVKMVLGVGAPMLVDYSWRKRDQEDRRLGIQHSNWRTVLRVGVPMMVNVADGATALAHN